MHPAGELHQHWDKEGLPWWNWNRADPWDQAGDTAGAFVPRRVLVSSKHWDSARRCAPSGAGRQSSFSSVGGFGKVPAALVSAGL